MSEDGVDLDNDCTTLASGCALDLTVRRGIVSLNGATFGENGMTITADGTAQMTLLVEDSTFDSLEGVGILLTSTGSSTAPRANYDLTVQRSTFDGAPAGDANGTSALHVLANNEGSGKFDLQNNDAANTGGFTFQESNSVIVKVDSDGLLSGFIDDNDVVNSFTGFGFDLIADGIGSAGDVQGTLHASLDGNTTSATSFGGIRVLTGDGTTAARASTAEVTLLNNLVGAPATNAFFGGIDLQTSATGSFETICANLATAESAGNNNATGPPVASFGAGILFGNNTGAHTTDLQGFAGGTDVVASAFINANNTSVPAAVAFGGIGAATCAVPVP
jgi:hypothetical protein